MIYAGIKDGINYGFYLEQTGLQNCIELTENEHMALMDGQSAGKVIVFHQDAKPTLENQPEPTDTELIQHRAAEITRELETIDTATTRPLRAMIAGSGTEEDEKKLIVLENEASALRAELRRIQG